MKTALMALATLVLVAPSWAWAAGALAIDENQGDHWGWAVDYATQQDADRRALSECGPGCDIVLRFSDTCAAYAADQTYGSTAYGWAYGYSSPSSAQDRALQECRSRGGADAYCIVRAWGCDGM